MSSLADRIQVAFNDVLTEFEHEPAGELARDTVLLESGLDSLGFAVLVARLEEELGIDPFSLSEEPFYPTTFGEFVDFYAKFSDQANTA